MARRRWRIAHRGAEPRAELALPELIFPAVDAAGARDLLLALSGVTEHAHFDKQAFRGITPKGKASKVFLTLWIEENRAVLMLDQEQQAELHARHPLVFFPVLNKWGEKGATFVELKACSAALFRQGVKAAMQLAGCA